MTETVRTEKRPWWVYILRCADGTLYCGSTPDIEARLSAHNDGRGAKYTRARLPVAIAYKRRMSDKFAALSEEARIKGLSRREKLVLVSQGA